MGGELRNAADGTRGEIDVLFSPLAVERARNLRVLIRIHAQVELLRKSQFGKR